MPIRVASKVDFIQQIAGGGERRIAAQDSSVERTNERKRGRSGGRETDLKWGTG